MKHDAIVVSSFEDAAIKRAVGKAKEIGLEVLGPSSNAFNGYLTILICPDGSKEGWPESNASDHRRAEFLQWLDGERYADNSSSFDWVAIAYSGDDWEAKITAHAWEHPLIDR